MMPSYFVPARNSRHRTAALALYRALVKTGKQVPLTNWVQHPGHVHPVVHVVRKRFAKSKTYTSLRLVYSSMAAGYKFLALLTKAQNVSAPEHAEVLSHLRQHSTAPRPHKRKLEPRPPLLTKVSGPNEPPRYASLTRPRPREELSGERKIPRLTMTAEGQPFLRIKKPQPRVLSQALKRKNRLFISRINTLLEIDEFTTPSAEAEDKWDDIVRKQMEAEGVGKPDRSSSAIETYRWSTELSRKWTDMKVKSTWDDWVARGKALHEIIDQEEALVEKEKSETTESPKQSIQERSSVTRDNQMEDKSFSRSSSATDSITTSTTFEDPFLSDRWAAIVKRMESKRLYPSRNNPRSKAPETYSYGDDLGDVPRLLAREGNTNPRNSFDAIMRLRR